MQDLNLYLKTLYCCMFPGCTRTYSTKFNLKRHVEFSHQNKKRHQCKTCKRWLASKQNLIEHCYTHTGDKPFVCLDCGQAFRQVSQYSLHRRRHIYEDKDEEIESSIQSLAALGHKRKASPCLSLKELSSFDKVEKLEVSLPPLKSYINNLID